MNWLHKIILFLLLMGVNQLLGQCNRCEKALFKMESYRLKFANASPQQAERYLSKMERILYNTSYDSCFENKEYGFGEVRFLYQKNIEKRIQDFKKPSSLKINRDRLDCFYGIIAFRTFNERAVRLWFDNDDCTRNIMFLDFVATRNITERRFLYRYISSLPCEGLEDCDFTEKCTKPLFAQKIVGYKYLKELRRAYQEFYKEKAPF